jgi:ketosteroid isomerase-like protein
MESGQTSDFPITVAFRDIPVTDPVAERNRRTLVDGLTSMLAGDVEAFWAIYDPDVVFHEASCLPYGGVHRGLAAARAAHGQVEKVYGSLHSVFEAVLAAEDMVILYQTIHFKVRANGNTGSLPVSEMFRFRDGRIIEWRALYFDACMVAQAITGETKAA